MTEDINSIGAAACKILQTAPAMDKAELSHHYSALWFEGKLKPSCTEKPQDRPARPEKPALLLPRDMPRRRQGKGSKAHRVALLHAVCHIELNAIDLAWDIVARFGHDMPKEFINDWVEVADDEARHFNLLQSRLSHLDAQYGDLPAHDGLWQAALDTRHDLAARLAIVPMVLEARGLDVSPPMIERLLQSGDEESADCLKIIYEEEISHVQKGQKWFQNLCSQKKLDARTEYQKLVKTYFKGHLKPPFNKEARDLAGFDEGFYLPISLNKA